MKQKERVWLLESDYVVGRVYKGAQNGIAFRVFSLRKKSYEIC